MQRMWNKISYNPGTEPTLNHTISIVIVKKTYRTLFNGPKQNCMRNLERFWQSSLLSKIPTLFFHQSLHLFLYRTVKCPTEAEKIEYTKMSYLIIDFEGQNETMYNRINFHSLSSLYYKS